MNFTNLLGTITAILTVVSGFMTTVLKCAPGSADLTAVCGAEWLGSYAGIAALVFGVVTLVLKLMRPGGVVGSLFGSTAVVVPDGEGKPGVVTEEQVKSVY